jgi:pyruvate, water dikinase
MSAQSIIPFEKIGIANVPEVGGKNASLGEMVRALASQGVRVPTGFATTADAYRNFIQANDLNARMSELINRFRSGEIGLPEAGDSIRGLILDSALPATLAEAIRAAYHELGERTGKCDPAVAVRSSATAEDLPDASFAGQQETFLNVRGARALLESCLRCYASLFTDRAIAYREAKNFDHMDVALSIGIQLMVRSDLAGSGVMFSIDTESGFPRAAVINAAWGLGETVVQGSVDPDKYVIFKPLLKEATARPIIEKSCGGKVLKMIYAQGGSRRTRIVETDSSERQAFVLSDDEIIELGRWAEIVENHYGRPMDMEWAKDGESGELFMVQARPETVQAGLSTSAFTHYKLVAKGRALITGAAVGNAIAAAPACVIRSAADIARFREGAILVTEMTDPDWVPIMKRAAGIITNHGGTTSHAAIVSRELGVPAIVGTGSATEHIAEGQAVTLCCAEGDIGTVYDGLLPYEAQEIDLGSIPDSRTEIMVNIANPAAAFQWWRLPAKGVGLARMEFIINSLIKIHPMAILHPERVSEADLGAIREITCGRADPEEFFVETLARGIAKLATPFHPHPAIVRLSDFKTNEYAHLIGGAAFEPTEENPMIGFRGASRYYDERYREGFALECRALKKVREELGFRNVIVMVPFCRTPEEADKVLAVMADNGLARGEEGLQIYMMCEIPSNVVLAEKFAERFDGFSIGSNDLTQLVLGVDRDSGLLSGIFDERNEAVKIMVSEAIRKAHAAGIKIGICGQGPSDHSDFAAFLVSEGIDSISLNPDSFIRTAEHIAAAEAQHGYQNTDNGVRQ